MLLTRPRNSWCIAAMACAFVASSGALVPAIAQTAPIDPRVVPDPRTGLMMLDGQSRAQVIDILNAELERVSRLHDGIYYTRFSLGPGTGTPQQPQGGFTQRVPERGAPRVDSGLMEIRLKRDWRVTPLPSRDKQVFNFVVGLDIGQVRVIDPGRGVLRDARPLGNSWDWNGSIREGRIFSEPNMTMAPGFKTDSNVRKLVAQIFNVSPNVVDVRRPTLAEVEAVVAAVTPRQTPSQPVCGAGEQWDPRRGQCYRTRDPFYKPPEPGEPNRPWRAPYGGAPR